MSTRIAVTCQKGGTGKTTSTINVAGALNKRGRSVLLVDLDPQGNLTEAVGFFEHHESPTSNLYDFLMNSEVTDAVEDLILHHNEFDVLPSHYDMFSLESDLAREADPIEARTRLIDLLRGLSDNYDMVLIDCPPSLGILSDSAVVACQNVLIPLQAQGSSIRALEFLYRQFEELEEAFEDLTVKVRGLIANQVRPDNEAREMMDLYQARFAQECPVYEIRERVALQRAWKNAVSIFEHTEESGMEETYLQIAKDLEGIDG